MTIASVVTKYQKHVTAAKLHQAYNFLQQTAVFAQNDYGDMSGWECFQYGHCTAEEFAQKYIIPYLKDTKIKTYRALVGAGYKTYPTYLNGETTMTGWRYFIKVKQGYLYMISHYDVGDGSRRVWGANVDINGEKPPNIIGKDIFGISYGYNIKPSKHYTLHMSNYYNYNREQILEKDCNKNSSGNYCGALIELDGWKIAPDYPW